MDKLIITTVDGTVHEMPHPSGRAYRIAAEFNKNQPSLGDVDFIERHAEFIAEFFPDVTVDDVLDMPLEEIFPAAIAVYGAVINLTWEKTREVSKNSEADKAQ